MTDEIQTNLEFLEGPSCDLLDLDLGEMTDEQLSAALAEIKLLTLVPGGMNRAMEIEAGSVAIGRPKPKRTKRATSIDDLF